VGFDWDGVGGGVEYYWSCVVSILKFLSLCVCLSWVSLVFFCFGWWGGSDGGGCWENRTDGVVEVLLLVWGFLATLRGCIESTG
jgi:hypothetical protein